MNNNMKVTQKNTHTHTGRERERERERERVHVEKPCEGAPLLRDCAAKVVTGQVTV